MTRNN